MNGDDLSGIFIKDRVVGGQSGSSASSGKRQSFDVHNFLQDATNVL